MKTVILPDPDRNEFDTPLRPSGISSMFPLLNRPFIEHVVRHLASQDCKDIQIVTGHDGGCVEEALGTGERWGCRIGYQRAADYLTPGNSLKQIARDHAEPLLLVHANRLVDFSVGELQNRANAVRPIVLAFRDAAGPGSVRGVRWTGWAVLPRSVISRFTDGASQEELGQQLISEALEHSSLLIVPRPLETTSYADVLQSQDRGLRKKPRQLLNVEKEIREGLWVGRNVKIHPTAQIKGPVLIGDNSRIDKRASIGPNAVIGENCFVDRDTSISDALVLSNTYLGPRLAVRDSVIDRQELVNVRLGTSVFVEDHLLLGIFPRRRRFSQSANRIVLR